MRNLPLRNDAPLDPHSASYVSWLNRSVARDRAWINTTRCGMPIVWAGPTTKPVKVTLASSSYEDKGADPGLVGGPRPVRGQAGQLQRQGLRGGPAAAGGERVRVGVLEGGEGLRGPLVGALGRRDPFPWSHLQVLKQTVCTGTGGCDAAQSAATAGVQITTRSGSVVTGKRTITVAPAG